MNMSDPIGDRHLSIAGFDTYLSSGVPILHPIAGEPPVSIFIDPEIPELGLRVHDTFDDRPLNTNLQHVLTRRTRHHGERCLEIVITVPSLFRDAYSLLCATADRIQVDNLRPAEALRVTLRRLSMLLRPNDSLSAEREVGLFGELLTLDGLIEVLGPKEAVGSWRGGDAEEHDFGLRDIDIEVKTTTTERRAHWISSLTQLVSTGDRPLWLVSHQLTSAGLGDGARLPDLVDSVRRAVGEGETREIFESCLVGAGWIDEFKVGCTTRWTKRTSSLGYAVTPGFPRLTPDSLLSSGVDLAHVAEVKYRIDLSGYPGSDTSHEALLAAIGSKDGND